MNPLVPPGATGTQAWYMVHLGRWQLSSEGCFATTVEGATPNERLIDFPGATVHIV
jgi:hypothetical protein